MTTEPPTPAPATPAPAQDAPAPVADAPAAGAAVPASAWGYVADQGFAAKLGSGLRLTVEQLAARDIDLSQVPSPVPGLALRSARFRRGAQRLDITADVAIPHVASGEFTVRVRSDGTAAVHGRVNRQLALPALGNPDFRLSLDENGQITAEVTVEGADLAPRIAGLEATGGGTLRLSGGKVSGNGTATLTYRDLGTGTVNFSFSPEGAFAADGTLTITPPFMDQISAEIGVDADNNVTASATLAMGQVTTSVPHLSLTAGTLEVTYENGAPAATLTDFSAAYAGFGQITVATASLDRSKRFSGTGSFALTLGEIVDVAGRVTLRNGGVTGSVTLSAEDIPGGLPINSGSITATLGENNALGFSGTLGVDFGPAGSGTLSASYSDAGDFSLGADLELTIPGLTTASLRVDYTNGDLSGEGQIPIDTALLPGIDGTVTVRYQQGLWSGETELNYSADDGKLSGTIRITVAQNDEGALQIGGGGSVRAQLMPRLAGTLTAEILPEGGVDISGAIEVTEPLELFPERRTERELFRYSQNIPLWAMLVAVIRARGGVRAGIGPGVFRNIRVEGSYTIGAGEADPSFSITGELFIPAFVEGYVAFGAGLGLDVVLGSLTGGIEGVATAGIYGAISVVPELSYEQGDWGIEGVATMAAGARLKLSLNAWAEVEAFWVTVWSREWELAQHTMSIGPDLGLQARMSYKFGQPEPPEIEMNSSDIDTESLIQDAMPEDGPPGSGAREALENRAEWQGALREQRAAPVPPEQAAQANAAEPAPQPAQRRGSGGGGGGGGGTGPGGGGPRPGENAAAPTGSNASSPPQGGQNQAAVDAARTDTSAQGSVPPDQVPNANDVRYPNPITLDTLNEAPAPVPRTRAQEQQDVDAAKRVLELASAQASDSDTLDAYFPAVKRRFRLATLGYEGDFQRGFKIHGGINPNFDFEPNEPLRGTGLPSAAVGRKQTLVEWQTDTLGGSQVGKRMEAMPLGPDHPRGTTPEGTAQGTLMEKLPTNRDRHPGLQNRYIRGHLLNHHVGGPGTPRNMFPITAQANSQHSSQIENVVKEWVNTRRFWVKYTVQVTSDMQLIKQGTQTKNGRTQDYHSIESTFMAEASALDMNLNPVSGLSRRVTITSRYQSIQSATPTGFGGDRAAQEAAMDAHEAQLQSTPEGAADRVVEHAVQIQEADGSTRVFPGYIETDLTRALSHNDGSWTAVNALLRGHTGFGPQSERVLQAAYTQVHGRDDKNVYGLNATDKGILTRIIRTWNDGLGDRL